MKFVGAPPLTLIPSPDSAGSPGPDVPLGDAVELSDGRCFVALADGQVRIFGTLKAALHELGAAVAK
jgi:hypothetical protein